MLVLPSVRKLGESYKERNICHWLYFQTGQKNTSYVHDVASSILSIYKEASKDPEVLVIGQKVLLPCILLKSIPSAIGVPESWYLDQNLIEVFSMIAAITTRLSSLRYVRFKLFKYLLFAHMMLNSDQQLSINDAFKLFVEGDFSSVPTSFDQHYIDNSTLRIFGSTDKVSHTYNKNEDQYFNASTIFFFRKTIRLISPCCLQRLLEIVLKR